MTRRLRRKLASVQQLKFLATGLLTVAADYTTFFLTFTVGHVDLGVATVASFLAGFIVSFGLNKLWVFENSNSSVAHSMRQVFLYVALLTFNVAFTYCFIAALEQHLGVDPRVSKMISIAITTVWNYVLYSRVIFLGGQRDHKNR
ncbi:GtrA family protein [Modestobacter italicus]|uniref:GtrA family protein n=1 Tax=Modestobacter italicus (strain DSM 44449 / CECT 9708 / BC 501) TaxID=2732864 RepID=UPI001C940964|nr:GtrA family protein [Modestobacter italicus]